MELRSKAYRTLMNLSAEQMEAYEEVLNILYVRWQTTTSKKDTQFETIWQLAKKEGKSEGIREFLQFISNPPKYGGTPKTRLDQATS